MRERERGRRGDGRNGVEGMKGGKNKKGSKKVKYQRNNPKPTYPESADERWGTRKSLSESELNWGESFCDYSDLGIVWSRCFLFMITPEKIF